MVRCKIIIMEATLVHKSWKQNHDVTVLWTYKYICVQCIEQSVVFLPIARLLFQRERKRGRTNKQTNKTSENECSVCLMCTWTANTMVCACVKNKLSQHETKYAFERSIIACLLAMLSDNTLYFNLLVQALDISMCAMHITFDRDTKSECYQNHISKYQVQSCRT